MSDEPRFTYDEWLTIKRLAEWLDKHTLSAKAAERQYQEWLLKKGKP